MQRYFSSQKMGNQLFLSSSNTYHITTVMRMKEGDKIEVVYRQIPYLCELITLEPFAEALIIKAVPNPKELDIQVTIAQSLVKEQKMDYILQKTTELGVSEIIPYQAERSVVKIEEKMDKKIARWQKIVKGASEQSKRITIPLVQPVMDLSNLVNLIDFDMKFLCTVNEKSQNLKKVLSNLKGSVRILFVIGPEGGSTENEENILIENGFYPISLGNNVLRTETASTFIMSVIRFLDMR